MKPRRSRVDFTSVAGVPVSVGLVLLGHGEMNFHPSPDTEKGQVRIFAGTENLEERIDGITQIDPVVLAELRAR